MQNKQAPKPFANDPLGLLGWLLEHEPGRNQFIASPAIDFEVHSYDFCPLKRQGAVKLSMVSFVITRSVSQALEVRSVLCRRLVEECIRLNKANLILICRVNDESSAKMDSVYHAIQMELEKLKPRVKYLTLDASSQSIQIILERKP